MNKEKYAEILVSIPQRKLMFSFEGIDGSGKSTQVALVKERLRREGVDSVIAAVPSNTLVGRFLRENLLNLEPWQRMALFLIDKIATLKKYETSRAVLLWDRYKDSDVVSNKDITPAEVVKWVSCLPDPVRTFLLDINPRIVFEQRKPASDGYSLDIMWQNLKYERYCKLAKEFPDRIVIVNGNQDQQAITEQIMRIILSDLTRIKNQ